VRGPFGENSQSALHPTPLPKGERVRFSTGCLKPELQSQLFQVVSPESLADLLNCVSLAEENQRSSHHASVRNSHRKQRMTRYHGIGFALLVIGDLVCGWHILAAVGPPDQSCGPVCCARLTARRQQVLIPFSLVVACVLVLLTALDRESPALFSDPRCHRQVPRWNGFPACFSFAQAVAQRWECSRS